MGASTSTDQVSSDQQEVETLAASTGALPMLKSAFSKLADPQTNLVPLELLQQCFHVSYQNPIIESLTMPGSFPALMEHLGSSMVDHFFIPEKGGVSWVGFLRGYIKCCGRMPASELLSAFFRVFAATASKAGLSLKLQFESDDADCKISGFLLPTDILMLLWMCWTMSWDFQTSKFSRSKPNLFLPDIKNLVLSAVFSCTEVVTGSNAWDCDVLSLEVQVPIGKFLTWAMKTVPCLPNILSQFVHARLQKALTTEEVELGSSSSSTTDISSNDVSITTLLTRGTSWAISLSQRGAISEEISKTCFTSHGDESDGNLLYRSSLHGRGLNRFCSNVEGYHGPLLLLISATSGDAAEGCTHERRWIIGALTLEGLENKDLFYGSGGNLYSISPVFGVFSSTGREKNLVYSHLHPSGRVYEPHPKPVGIAFGGTVGNERIFIDEDFARVTVRHHAGDKSYQPGSLFPDQGFLPVEASILEVEVWGFGGSKAKEVQNAYKNREQLFTEQRRKVDLKTFANWEDSPEKMMMDMMSDPNAVRREDR